VRFAGAALSAGALALATAAGVARAALPVTNGPIVFESSDLGRPAVGIANADGSDYRPNLIAVRPADRDAAVSRDGTRLAFTSRRDANEEIYVAAIDGSGQRDLSRSPARDHDPAWGPGDRIAFASNRAGGEHIFIEPAGGGAVAQLTSGPGVDQQPSWSPDGRQIVFAGDRSGSLDLYVADVATGAVRDITPGPEPDVDPDWGPTGAIAFTRGAFGSQQIYRIDPDGKGLTRLTANAGDNHFPAWSPDGTEIAYTQFGQIQVMSATKGDKERPLGFTSFGGVDGKWGPAPAPAPAATPVPGDTFIVEPGGDTTARVRPGSAATTGTLPTKLRSDVVVPPRLGVDVRVGAVTVKASTPQSGSDVTTIRLSSGRFAVTQPRGGGAPLIRFRGPPPRPCRGATAARKRRHHHHQSAHVKGKGKVKPHYGGAAPSGTTWTVTETCAGSRYSVQEGRLVVTYRGRRITVRAGHSFLARR
jgi:dipeptidyl aminopeptidase/acylaminoacyl peptidase